MCQIAAGCAFFPLSLSRGAITATVRYVQVEGICSVISMQLATGAHRNSSHATEGFTSLSTWQQPMWFGADYNLEVLVNSR